MRWLVRRSPFLILAVIVGVAVALVTTPAKKVHVYGVGSAQVLVDSNPSVLAKLNLTTSAQTLSTRAPLYAEFATGTPVVQSIASHAGVPASSLSVTANTGQASAATGYINTPPASSGTGSNSVKLTADGSTPLITVSTRASSASLAERLANATVLGLQQSLHSLQASQHIPGNGGLVLRPLGHPTGSTAASTLSSKKGYVYGAVVLVVILLVIGLVDFGLSRRRTAPVVAAQ